MQKSPSSRGRSISAGALAAALVCMAVEWILLVAGVKLHEIIVGAVAVSAGALFMWRVFALSSERLDLRLPDVLTAWRVPWMLMSDICVVTIVLLKDVSGMERAGSAYRVSGFRSAKRDHLLIARDVLATLYITSTPNSIVLGIDPAQSRIVVHQLAPRPASRLERELGGQP